MFQLERRVLDSLTPKQVEEDNLHQSDSLPIGIPGMGIRTDSHCIDWRHFARLSSFTNPKEDGRQPFVLLRYAEPIVSTCGYQCLVQEKRMAILTPPTRACLTRLHPTSCTYSQHKKRILHLNGEKPWTVDPDLSRLDFMIACEMQREGYHPQDVEHELSIGSLFLSSRKSGHIKRLSQTDHMGGKFGITPFIPPLSLMASSQLFD